MSPTFPRAPRRLVAAAFVTAGLVGLAGCGSDDEEPSASGDASGLAAIAPANAPVYGEVVLRPEGDRAADLQAAVEKVAPGEDLGKRLQGFFDESAKEDGVTYAQDVAPWLGQRVGGVLTALPQSADGDPDFALIAETTDKGKAEAFLKKTADGATERTHNGTTYLFDAQEKTAGAVVGEQVVLGTEGAFKAVVDASKGDALGEQADFQEVRGRLDEDLGFVYGDVRRLFEALKSVDLAGSGISQKQLDVYREQVEKRGISTVGASFGAEKDNLSIEFAGKFKEQEGEGGASDLVKTLPAGSWLAAGLGDLGQTLKSALEGFGSAADDPTVDRLGLVPSIADIERMIGLDFEKDLIAWMGQGGLFARGTSITEIGGALVVESKDEAATKRALDKLRKVVTDNGLQAQDATTEGVDEGFQVVLPGAPIAVYAVLGEGKFVLAANESSLRDALNPAKPLSDDAAFKAGKELLDGGDPAFFLDFKTVTQFISQFAGGDPGFQAARKYLEAFTTVVAGQKRDGEFYEATVAVGLR